MAECVLVTGHTGFVGKALVRALEKRGYNVLGCSASTGQNLCNPHWYESLPDTEITHVFHVAAATRIAKAWNAPRSFFDSNVRATQHVLDFCLAHTLPLTYVSAYVYGQPLHLPIHEEHPVRPDNPYAHSKYIAEQLCCFHSQYAGLQVKIARIFNIYGEGQSEDFVIPHILRQLLGKGHVQLHSNTRRDFIHVDDVVEALLCLMHGGGAHTVYNVGSGRSYSLCQVVDMAASLLDISSSVEVAGVPRPQDVADVVADTTRLEQDFCWRCTIDLQEGLLRCLASAQKYSSTKAES